MHLRLQLILPILSLLTLVLASSSPSAPSSPHPSTTDILYWPLASPRPSLLARVGYNPASSSADVLSYSPPKPTGSSGSAGGGDGSEGLVRVGLYTSTPSDSKHWVGTLASVYSLVDGVGSRPTVQLHLGPENEVYHVSVKLSSSSDTPTAESGPIVELVPSTAGPRPHLNRPIVVSPDGQGPQEVVEKTFFQR